jgi:hypothetical protein
MALLLAETCLGEDEQIILCICWLCFAILIIGTEINNIKLQVYL